MHIKYIHIYIYLYADISLDILDKIWYRHSVYRKNDTTLCANKPFSGTEWKIILRSYGTKARLA